MTKLEKSIRHELKFYGSDLRAGRWGVAGYSVGQVPHGFRFLEGAYCDIGDGEVTDIRLYAYGNAYAAKDVNGDSIDITKPIEEYLRGETDRSWDKLIFDIQACILQEE